MSLQSEWQRCGIHQEIHGIHGKLQQDAPLLDHLELLFQHRPTLSNVGQPKLLRFLIQMAIDWGLHRYPLFIQDFILCYSVLSCFIHFLDRHGQNMDKFNGSQLPYANLCWGKWLWLQVQEAPRKRSLRSWRSWRSHSCWSCLQPHRGHQRKRGSEGVSLWDPYAT